MLDIMAKQNRDHEYLVYQRNKYHNIPLWVIMNTLTFGQISKMFEFFTSEYTRNSLSGFWKC